MSIRLWSINSSLGRLIICYVDKNDTDGLWSCVVSWRRMLISDVQSVMIIVVTAAVCHTECLQYISRVKKRRLFSAHTSPITVLNGQTSIICRWQTHVICWITANVLQRCMFSMINVQPKLTTLVTVDILELMSKVTNCNLSHLHLHFGASVGGNPIWVLVRSSASEN